MDLAICKHSLPGTLAEGFSLTAAALPEGFCLLCLISLVVGAAELPPEEAQKQQLLCCEALWISFAC